MDLYYKCMMAFLVTSVTQNKGQTLKYKFHGFVLQMYDVLPGNISDTKQRTNT